MKRFSLSYATVPPSRRVRVIRHDDGISIRFPRRASGIAAAMFGDVGQAGAEGCLMFLLSPVVALAALGWMWRYAVTYAGLAVFALGALGLVVWLWLFMRHRGGPEISVRGGSITYRDTEKQSDGAVLREWAVADVERVLPGDGHPIFRGRDGNDELFGGYDPIDIPEYATLDPGAKRWVAETLCDALGLAPPQSDDSHGTDAG
jgi:hypothetical protein